MSAPSLPAPLPLRIEQIEIFHVAMPLLVPFTTAYGSDEAIHSVLVRLDSGGLSGWGESCPLQFPTYSPEWAAGVFQVVREVLAPRLVGRTIASAPEVRGAFAAVKGNPFAKAALDLAWWDLAALAAGQPLWRMIGGQSDVAEAGADFGVMAGYDELLAAIAGANRAGFKRIKLKFRPGWDVEMVATVRRAFPDTVFHIDCNSAYTLADLPLFQQLDEYNLAMIEQPLAHDDLLDHAALQRRIRTPVCLDESITSPDKARQAIEIGACRWINLKPARVGGLTPALQVHDLCQAAGLPCWIGGMLESGVGASVCQALATLPGVKYPSDIFPGSRFYREDLGVPELVFTGPAQMRLPSGPGIGVRPEPGRLARLTVASARFRV